VQVNVLKLKAFKMGEELRRELSKPWGLVITNDEIESGKLEEALKSMRADTIVTVGDVTTHKFFERGLMPKLAIVDMKTLRGIYQVDLRRYMKVVREVVNPPGHIVSTIVDEIGKAFKEGGLVMVRGEEDLLVIPSVLALPEGVVVAYGQPGVGVVLVKIDKDKKEKAKELLTSMKEVVLDDATISN
jgi:uncharacterized protein (UPF0218 family)